MGPWLLLIVLALVAAILGFATVAHWLFIFAVLFLVVGLVMLITGRGSRV